jgi:hypothetical protein
MMRLYQTVLLLFGASFLFSASAVERPLQTLSLLREKRSAQFLAKKQYALEIAQQKGFIKSGRLSDGRFIELMAIDPEPFYYVTTNSISSRTISTSYLYADGGMGLDLSGKSVPLALWDVGGVRLDHQEMIGRVEQLDNPSMITSHSTEVAGTLVASGVNPRAKGMAYNAFLQALDWNNDTAELATAADRGVILSNHSYGTLAGWVWNYRNDNKWAWFGNLQVDTYEDYHFGYYNYYAQDWDRIAYLSPHLLIVKAAGNDRNDTGPSAGTQYWVWDRSQLDWTVSTAPRKPDGDFDTLAGSALAKNVLTVGAVNDIINSYSDPADVQMTSYSSWGPTDDGRIKPDVVANGSSLYSTSESSTESYHYYSGTSAAAPSACGSLALLQELYHRYHGRYMLAATLKGLAIHTADEAGMSMGPDYKFGWGLLNIRNAADVIRKDYVQGYIILERSLSQNEDFSFRVYSDAIDPMILTLSWTDPPPSELGPVRLDARDPVLVNDLDIVCIRESDHETIYPWVLDVDHPDQPAVRAANHVDNVEHIYWQPEAEGYYRITISHTGSLQNYKQDFSLIISGASQQVFVKPKLYLQGPFDPVSHKMTHDLADQLLIPQNSPYDQDEVISSMIPPNGVDWVLVELRKTPYGESQSSKSALLRDDGSLWDPRSQESVLQMNAMEGSYYLAIKHRNHFTAISCKPLLFKQDRTVDYDFTFAPEKFYGSNAKVMQDGSCVVYAGDGDQSQDIWVEDYQLLKLNFDARGYHHVDYNLNGLVDREDYTLYFSNQGRENTRLDKE